MIDRMEKKPDKYVCAKSQGFWKNRRANFQGKAVAAYSLTRNRKDESAGASG